MSDHARQLVERLRRLTKQAAPEPWQQLPTFAVGGLAAVGFSADSNALLVASSGGGRSLYESTTGERIARDRDLDVHSWLSADGTKAHGIGPLAAERFQVAGLWGGGLSRSTADGWSCAIVAPDWPTELVVLQPPGRDVIIEKFAAGCVAIADSSIVEIRAAGFSRDGKTLVVATSADVTLWRMDVTGTARA